ncbi:MAG: hypothetical protein M1812_000108 [Candelaria pacifica]|nr:MAG: hypothetical protein M1812_000108 [Candelaria pacifica]
MPIVKRACDPCHRRKVKCNGQEYPCKNCLQSGLTCTFNAIPQKKGPKGSRAKVISELRATQRQSELAIKVEEGLHGIDTSPTSSVMARELLSSGIIDVCIEKFFANLYPTMPILHRKSLQQAAMSIGSSLDTYCLFSSLCAFMLIQPGRESPNIDARVSGTTLLEETLRVRRSCDYVEHTTLDTVTTSFFLFGCYFGLNKHNTAWFYLREATTLVQNLGMQHESTYQSGDRTECLRGRRLFWLLFVTERAYALQRHRPLTLHATIALPTIDDDPDETTAIAGFIHLVNLFRPFDDTFIGLWNKSRDDCSTEWLSRLQQQLSKALPARHDGTENQVADLRTSQQWLRMIVWQLSISNGYLSSSSAQPAMTFQYPIEIARDLATVTGQISHRSMEVHGIGLVEKLFDVACTLTDVMACVPINATTSKVGPRDYLHQFMRLVSTLGGGQSRFVPLLQAKIRETLPSSGTSMPLALPLAAFDDSTDEDDEGPASPDSIQSGSPSVTVMTGLEMSSLAISALRQNPTTTTPLCCLTTTLPMETAYPVSAAGGFRAYQRC